MTSEKDCCYVSIRGIAKNCDHYPSNIVSDWMHFDEEDYVNIKENDTVFVITSVLHFFCELVLPKLGDTKFKLVTGACIRGVPHEISELYSIDFMDLLKNNITHWFTQNFDGTNECIPIPLGMDYHTLQRRDHQMGPMASAFDQEQELKDIASFNFEEKKTRTFSYFHFKMTERNDSDRHRAIDHLKEVDFNDILGKQSRRKPLWNFMKDYKFIISPHGRGLDSHRTYESVLLGCVPIVRSSTLDPIYKDLPILIVEDWTDVNEELLENYEYTENLEKLKLSYWTDLIKRTC